MRICFLLESLGRSGGVGIVVGHAARLAARGVEVEIVLTRVGAGEAPDGVPVRSLEDALDVHYDLAFATWWTTAAPLFRLQASRRAVFLQGLEQRVYAEYEAFDRLGAAAVLALPVDYVAIAGWLADVVAELRPDARCLRVPNGIDKDVFRPRERRPSEGPLRVLVEGQPSLPFKGISEAVAAVREMAEPAELTLAALDPEEVGDVAADRVVGALSPEGMAELYAEHDVLLKLSRVESLGLPPIEAFHVGTPCVVTPFTGHEEYAVHGENAVVVGFDDLPGTSRWLDLLARDRPLLGRLSKGALATAERWPSPETSTGALLDALEHLRPRPDEGTAHWLAEIELAGALGRRTLTAIAAAREEIRELYASREECAEMLEDAHSELREATSSFAYRTAVSGRLLLDRIRRR